MKRILLFFAIGICAAPAFAEDANDRLAEAASVFNEVMATPEKGIPQDLLDRAHCVVIVPGMKKAAFVVGGQYGRGFAICRGHNNVGWGSPGAVRLEGASFGFQIGAESVDVFMLVMGESGMKRLLNDKFTLGGSASVAAGPVGRHSSAATDAFLSAQILSWSRTRGAFAGVSLNGSTLRNDLDENRELYGRPLHNRDILMKQQRTPKSAEPLVAALTKYSRHENR